MKKYVSLLVVLGLLIWVGCSKQPAKKPGAGLKPYVPPPAGAKAPEEKAPEAKAPEAKAPEAKAPEAKAPEAKAPEKAPEPPPAPKK